MLSHWGRDRKRGPGLPLPQLLKMQTSETADFFGFKDRGRLRIHGVRRQQSLFSANAWIAIMKDGLTPPPAADQALKRVEEIFAKYPIAQG